MKQILIICIFSSTIVTILGCDNQTADSPPTVRLDDSVCDQCNMIISDERWATATVIDGDRGPEPRLFDDFNCQVNYEIEHPEIKIVARWSHSHATSAWIRTEDAQFLISPALRAPMGSHVAAFGSDGEAESAKSELGGDVVSFETAWTHMGSADAPEKETHDAP